MRASRRRGRLGGTISGAILLLLGVAFLLDHIGVVSIGSIWEWWPLIFIAVGVTHLVESRWFSGAMYLIAGVWLLGWIHGYAPGLFAAWPVIPILAGLSLMRGATLSDPRNENHVAAFWSGNSVRFRGKPPATVTATAIMGGCELNLEGVELDEGTELTVITTAFWGGINIRIPEDWTVIDRVIPILGGVEHHPNPLANGKHLVLRGTACMGGIEVRTSR